MVADAGAPAYLALAPLAVMLAYLRSDRLLAPALYTVVGADAGAPAYLALAPFAVMLAYRRPTTLLALALFTVVGADAGAPAFLTATLLAVVRALLAWWPRHVCSRVDSYAECIGARLVAQRRGMARGSQETDVTRIWLVAKRMRQRAARCSYVLT